MSKQAEEKESKKKLKKHYRWSDRHVCTHRNPIKTQDTGKFAKYLHSFPTFMVTILCLKMRRKLKFSYENVLSVLEKLNKEVVAYNVVAGKQNIFLESEF